MDHGRSTGSDDPAAVDTSARSHIDHIVRVSDHIKIMFDNDDSSAVFDQAPEYMQQRLYIQRVQADGRFIKYKYRIRLPSAHFSGQLQPLGFPAGKAGSFFSQCQISQAQIMQDLQPFLHKGQVITGLKRLIYAHIHKLRQCISRRGFFRYPVNQSGFF